MKIPTLSRRTLLIAVAGIILVVSAVSAWPLYLRSDPVRSFSQFASNYIDRLKKKGGNFTVTYDVGVRKTDDLVRPYEGLLTIERSAAEWSDEVKITFLLTDGKWRYKTHNMSRATDAQWELEGLDIQELADLANGEKDASSDEKITEHARNMIRGAQ